MSYFFQNLYSHDLGDYYIILNTGLVTLSLEEVTYTSYSPHHKNRWYMQTYTASPLDGHSEALQGVAWAWEAVLPSSNWRGLAELPLFPADFSMKCFQLCTLWVQLFNRLQLVRLVTGWTTVTKEYRLQSWGDLERFASGVQQGSVCPLLCVQEWLWRRHIHSRERC